MRSSRARISNSPPRRARSSSTTRKSCSRMATAGRPRLPSSSPSRRPTDDKYHRRPGESRGRLFSCPGIRTVGPGFRRDCGVGRIAAMILQAVMFYLFAVVAVASGVMVVAARNPVHSVLFLILAFFNSAGLFVLMGAEFLAMILVIVYVGAVAVLFLFVVMMLDIDFAQLRSGFTKNLPFGIIVALVLAGEIGAALWSRQAGPAMSGRVIPAAGQPNIVALGQILYSRYLFPFEIAGLILLVAMIGAIVLTHRKRGDLRTPNASKQNRRRPGDAVRLTKPDVGAGVKL